MITRWLLLTSLGGVVIKIHGNSNVIKNGCTGFFCMDETFFNHLGPFFFKAAKPTPTDSRVEIVSQTESDIITEKTRVLPKAVNNEITWAPRSSYDPPIYDESEEEEQVNNYEMVVGEGENKEPLYDDDVSLTVVGSDLKFQDYDKWRPYYPGDNDEEVLFENHHDVNATVDELTAPLGSSTADANIRNNSEIRGSSDLFEHMEILPDNPLPFLDNILPDYNYEVDLSSQYEDDYVSRKSDDFTENTIDSTNETCPSHRCRCVCEDKFL